MVALKFTIHAYIRFSWILLPLNPVIKIGGMMNSAYQILGFWLTK